MATIEKQSLLYYASKGAFGCDDYEPKGERAEAFLVTPEDDLTVVLEKAKRLGDCILDGRSVAMALGDIKAKRRDEEEQKSLNLREMHIWQAWKRGRGELPVMEWQADREEQEEPERKQTEKKHEPRLGKRKNRREETEPSNQRLKHKKTFTEERAKVRPLDMAALAEIYNLTPQKTASVVESDVRYFRSSFPPLRPLLSAMVKVLQARSDLVHARPSKKLEEERKVMESHSTQKAIYLIEKQVKYIMEDANTTVEAIQDQISVLRGRLTAVDEYQGDNEEEEDEDEEMEARSSTEEVTTPNSSIDEQVRDQVEQDTTPGEGTNGMQKNSTNSMTPSSPMQTASGHEEVLYVQKEHKSDQTVVHDDEPKMLEQGERVQQISTTMKQQHREVITEATNEEGGHLDLDESNQGAEQSIGDSAVGEEVEVEQPNMTNNMVSRALQRVPFEGDYESYLDELKEIEYANFNGEQLQGQPLSSNYNEPGVMEQDRAQYEVENRLVESAGPTTQLLASQEENSPMINVFPRWQEEARQGNQHLDGESNNPLVQFVPAQGQKESNQVNTVNSPMKQFQMRDLFSRGSKPFYAPN